LRRGWPSRTLVELVQKNQASMNRDGLSRKSASKTSGTAGGSALEFALLMPWYVFLFVGAFDWGFLAHALISTESAARVVMFVQDVG
jgi:hypothetical protein